jgi:hypothetical protein
LVDNKLGLGLVHPFGILCLGQGLPKILQRINIIKIIEKIIKKYLIYTIIYDMFIRLFIFLWNYDMNLYYLIYQILLAKITYGWDRNCTNINKIYFNMNKIYILITLTWLIWLW